MGRFRHDNDYLPVIGRDFVRETPKEVFAAVAFALAMRLTADDAERAVKLMAEEWQTLLENEVLGEVPHVFARQLLDKKDDARIMSTACRKFRHKLCRLMRCGCACHRRAALLESPAGSLQ